VGAACVSFVRILLHYNYGLETRNSMEAPQIIKATKPRKNHHPPPPPPPLSLKPQLPLPHHL